jgi:hypothetical protein
MKMENSESGAEVAADNTVTSDVQDEPMLKPEVVSTGEPQGKETAEGESADKPLMTPDGGEEAEKDPGAPEKYEPFKLPEGFALEGEEFEKVSSMLKGMNLSQSHAQELVDYFTRRMTDEKAAGLNALAARRKEWRAAIRQRPDFANERGLVQRGMRAVLTDKDEKELFEDSWMSDHPAFWKVFAKVGRLVGEDSLPRGKGERAEQNINLLRFPNV